MSNFTSNFIHTDECLDQISRLCQLSSYSLCQRAYSCSETKKLVDYTQSILRALSSYKRKYLLSLTSTGLLGERKLNLKENLMSIVSVFRSEYDTLYAALPTEGKHLLKESQLQLNNLDDLVYKLKMEAPEKQSDSPLNQKKHVFLSGLMNSLTSLLLKEKTNASLLENSAGKTSKPLETKLTPSSLSVDRKLSI